MHHVQSAIYQLKGFALSASHFVCTVPGSLADRISSIGAHLKMGRMDNGSIEVVPAAVYKELLNPKNSGHVCMYGIRKQKELAAGIVPVANMHALLLV
jgi:hypothetical protein